jgi:hypothetical protein
MVGYADYFSENVDKKFVHLPAATFSTEESMSLQEDGSRVRNIG